VENLATRWAALGGESSDKVALERRSIETAIAREVNADLDGVLADLRGDNPRFRRGAAKGLGFVNSPRVLPALERALGDTGDDVRLVVDLLVSLGRIADPSTDDARLLPYLGHFDGDVRSDVALALARVFRARRNVRLAPIRPEERVPEVEAALFASIFDPEDPFVRGHAAQALGALGSSGAEDALANALRDEKPFPRLSAAHGLALCGTEKSIPPLLAALASATDENFRGQAALALGAIAERAGLAPPLGDLGTDAGKWRAWFGR